MAADNKVLKANMEDLFDENRAIKCILDVKQNKWTKDEHKKNEYPVTTS